MPLNDKETFDDDKIVEDTLTRLQFLKTLSDHYRLNCVGHVNNKIYHKGEYDCSILADLIDSQREKFRTMRNDNKN